MNICISKFSNIWERKILKEFILGLLTKNDVCLQQMRAFFFTQQFSAGEWVWHQCVGMSGIWWSLRFVVETLLVNDMPLSSSLSLGSPPILRAKRDNEGADSLTQLHTKRRGISTTHNLSLHSEKLSILFYLFSRPSVFQQSSDACSNLFKNAY